jgi:hypothetical protein
MVAKNDHPGIADQESQLSASRAEIPRPPENVTRNSVIRAYL